MVSFNTHTKRPLTQNAGLLRNKTLTGQWPRITQNIATQMPKSMKADQSHVIVKFTRDGDGQGHYSEPTRLRAPDTKICHDEEDVSTVACLLKATYS